MQIPALLKTEAALVVAGIVGLVLVTRNVKGLATGAVHVVGDAATGAVLGVGDVLGVPRTDETECQAAMREGRSWDASFACPAGTYLNYVMHGYIDTTNKGLL